MSNRLFSLIVLGLAIAFGGTVLFIGCADANKKSESAENEFMGSESCIECHERFYELWAPSHHGKAMQMIDSTYIAKDITPFEGEPMKVGNNTYEVVFTNDSILFVERNEQNQILKRLPAVWALGGRNVSFLLTPWEGGRLQTLPLAYDHNKKSWYNNPAAGVRHFTDEDLEDSELDWKHSLFTFNTTCHGCHVSQLEKNYDPKSQTYHTIWQEPGINCETCHGPSKKHIEVARRAEKEGRHLEKHELELIVTSTFTQEQHNSSCSPCHAKMSPITTSYPPGDKFYDHFNAITFDNPDFYPDGRDLGENYTWPTWQQNKCKMESELHCVSCHTSSGRDRNHDNPNNSCTSCHTEHGKNFEEHTHHKNDGKVTCVSCHMPNTMFARMTRSDHSFRPPMPAATIEFGSPNACNICHDDKSAKWANKHVTKWHGKEYQKETLYYGGLIKAARDDEDYSRVDEMYKMIKESKPNEMFVTSMIRLLEGSMDEGKMEVFIYALKNDKSPLSRSAAADGLRNMVTPQTKDALILAAQDSFRVVRVSAGAALANYPDNMFSASEAAIRNKVFEEYKQSQLARPDHWSAHYNLGNFHMGRNEMQKAIDAFETASQLEPEVVSPYVNSSLAYSHLQNPVKAEEKLKVALKYDPDNAATNVNYGLLLGELGRMDEAKKVYKKALELDKNLVTAAYNLAVICAKDDMNESLKYSKMAYNIRPEDPKYLYTYVYFLNTSGKVNESTKMAQKLIKDFPNYMDGYAFLESIYLKGGNKKAVVDMYSKALKNNQLDAQVAQVMNQRLQMMQANY